LGNESQKFDAGDPLAGIGDRFEEVAELLFDGSKSELARALDMKPPSFYKYAAGRRHPGAQILLRVTQMGISVDWLLSGEGPRFRGGAVQARAVQSTAAQGETAQGETAQGETAQGEATEARHSSSGGPYRVPVVALRQGSDGPPLKPTGAAEWIGARGLRERHGVDPVAVRVLSASGDAMRPTIEPGDRVWIAMCDEPASLCSGNIYLTEGGMGIALRRLRLEDDVVILEADNPDVAHQIVDGEAWRTSYKVLGRAFEVTRPL
jgi:phage repressor protein C with HTH and peptisase S24 domain